MNSITVRSFRDGEPFGEHVVAVAAGRRSLEIREIRNLPYQPDALATCFFEIHPRDYARAEIQLRRGAQRMTLNVDVDDVERTITLTCNDHEPRVVGCDDCERILLDGPSPMFDWANAVMMLGICDNEVFSVPVYSVDVRSCSIVRSQYTYRRTDQLITVHKGIDALGDSEIRLRSDYSVDVYYSGGYRYDFAEGGARHDES